MPLPILGLNDLPHPLIPADILLPFFLASAALALAPGPDNLFVLTQSALHGRRAGLLVTLGLCTGLVVHTLLVALGVAALMQTSPLAFSGLRLAGAAYLLYLAWGAFTAATAGPGQGTAPVLSHAQLYRRGIIMNVTNPKVTIFFLAFLPQFADPARGALVPQLLQLGAWFMLAALLVMGSVALFGGSIGHWLRRRPGSLVWLNRLAGLVFVGLALRLLIDGLAA